MSDDPVADGSAVATDEEAPAAEADGSRTAAVRTTHADADLVAAALAPDDTDSMAVRVDGGAIDCRIERPTTGGLRSTVDDYVVNLRVAERVIERAREHRTAGETTDGETVADGETAGDETTADAAETRDSDTDTHTDTNT
ncbi:KEOPS complex subunit Pcc1 [Halorubrum aethiopicum]|uniref:KEOPS complex subunit Pcc1 n=1 Tax=Halorubrum aethiopicum TaxID=1758255 RepID=UPI00082DF99F|nr:KEOPS complex subunit Pcc1 [Halorubrum aethiopicum]